MNSSLFKHASSNLTRSNLRPNPAEGSNQQPNMNVSVGYGNRFQQSEINDMQQQKQQLVIRRLQEHQQQQQTQQFGSSRHRFANQSTLLNGGTDAEICQYPSSAHASPSWMYQSSDMQGFNGLLYQPNMSQTQHMINFEQQQFGQFHYEVPVSSSRCLPVIPDQSSMTHPHISVSSSYGNGNPHNLLTDHAKDESSIPRHNYRSRNMHGVVSAKNEAGLDPEEEQFLYGNDDNIWNLFGTVPRISEESVNIFSNGESSNGLTSVQSGSWSALMLSVVVETSSNYATPQSCSLMFHSNARLHPYNTGERECETSASDHYVMPSNISTGTILKSYGSNTLAPPGLDRLNDNEADKLKQSSQKTRKASLMQGSVSSMWNQNQRKFLYHHPMGDGDKDKEIEHNSQQPAQSRAMPQQNAVFDLSNSTSTHKEIEDFGQSLRPSSLSDQPNFLPNQTQALRRAHNDVINGQAKINEGPDDLADATSALMQQGKPNAVVEVPLSSSTAVIPEASEGMNFLGTVHMGQKKCKNDTFQLRPWRKEISDDSHDCSTRSTKEADGVQASNRTTAKVDDIAEPIEDSTPMLRSKRRLIRSTHLMQQLIGSSPATTLSVDASSCYDVVAYSVSRIVLGDACHKVSCATNLDTSSNSLNLPLENRMPLGRDVAQRHEKTAEELCHRVKRIKTQIQRIEESASSLLDLRFECGDLESLPAMKRLRKVHAETESTNASTKETPPENYFTAKLVPKGIPKSVDCLSL